MKKADLVFTTLLVPLDFLMLISAGISAYFLRVTWIAGFRPVYFHLSLPFNKYLGIAFAVSLFWLFTFALAGLYQMGTRRKPIEEFSYIVIASSAAIMAIIIYIFLKREWFDSRFILMAAWILAILFVSSERFLVRQIAKVLRKRWALGVERVLLIGGDRVSKNLSEIIKEDRNADYKIVGHLLNPDIGEVSGKIKNPGVDEVLLGDPNYPRKKILELIDFCNEKHIDFRFVPNLFYCLTTNVGLDTLKGIPLVELKRTSLDGWGRVWKRMIDILGSLVGFFFLSPFFVLIAFIIKWDSEGPVFAKLKRISGGKDFYLYKFRSMVKGAEKMKKKLMPLNERKNSPLFKMRNDPRITRVGRLIRRTRIDELPQLFNVLKGEMSLVGPRPHEPEEISRYEKRHKKLLALKGGMTGLAQVSGSSDLPFEEEVKLGVYYIENWSPLLDLKILFKTFIILFTDKSAC